MSSQTDPRVDLDALYIGMQTDHGRLQTKYYGGFLAIQNTGENDLFSIDIDNENGSYVTAYIDRATAWRLLERIENELSH